MLEKLWTEKYKDINPNSTPFHFSLNATYPLIIKSECLINTKNNPYKL